MSRNLKISAVLLGAFIALGAVLLLSSGDDDVPEIKTEDARVVRDNSHRLSTSDDKVVFVEFLDFECEACGAFYPYIEQLREDYEGRVTFVARYFPLSGHFNAERAARAVEAAAQQDNFEEMYKKMYDTQKAWAEQRVPADDTFRQYAVDLGLDMAKWDIDYNSTETLERIRQDQADGEALGVNSTPTFFLNGERFEPESFESFTEAFDAALDA